MPKEVETGSSKTAIRPLTVSSPETELTELRRRIKATRWPERETVPDGSQGVQLATIQKLASYWGDRLRLAQVRGEAQALPHFMTEIDGLDIHFIHVRSKHEECAAAHRHAWLARLDHRAAEDHRAADRSDLPWRECSGRVSSGDPLDAGLRLFGKAKHDRPGSAAHRPRAWPVLMKRLGYEKFVAQGGDWGAIITDLMGVDAPPGLLGIHTNMAVRDSARH